MLLERFLRRGFRVLAPARPRGTEDAAARIRRICRTLEVTASAGAAVAIDIARLGGAASTLPPPDAVVHAAAAVKFEASEAELMAANVIATARLLDLLDRWAPEAAFHFVSTAYVSGATRGPFREEDRAHGVTCHRSYESSKRVAEALVRAHCKATRRPFSIYRPAIIAGESDRGRAASFHGIYGLLRATDALLRRLRSGEEPVPVAIRCDPEATKNIVPADWVAGCIADLLERGASGRTYHLTHPRPLRHREITAALDKVFGARLLRASAAAAGVASTPAQRCMDRALETYSPYLWGEPAFDRSNLVLELGESAMPPPVDTDYFRKLIDYGRRVGWRERPFEDVAGQELQALARVAE
jgi:nucleoside-diphosphate-sugar epimerase